MPARRPRKIIVSIATSADGYIARPDGGVEWLDRPMPRGNYGMGAFVRSIDTILWGRKTYDIGLKLGGGSMPNIAPGITNYVFTHRPPESAAPPEIQFVNEPVEAFAKKLRSERGKDIWMMGGAALIASFLDAGQIDEFSIHVMPVMIGDGIRLIQPRRRNVPLELLSTRQFPDGVVHLNYRVSNQ